MSATWSARVIVDFAHVEVMERVFSEHATVVSLYEHDESRWAVEGLFTEAPPRALLAARLALAAQAAGIDEPDLLISSLQAKDWLTENIASFPPVRAGRFFVHGDHIRPPYPPGAVRCRVNAATAFGSGEHESTRGCLLALDGLLQLPGRRDTVLDMGCGTGLLAIAAAKGARKGRRRVLAVDIDPEAVRVTRDNVQKNGVRASVTTVLSEGCGTRAVRKNYGLITANILARPLMHMACDIARRLAPGGYLVLSGLLRSQEAMVQNAYRLQGLHLVRRIRLKAWSTLILKRRIVESPGRSD